MYSGLNIKAQKIMKDKQRNVKLTSVENILKQAFQLFIRYEQDTLLQIYRIYEFWHYLFSTLHFWIVLSMDQMIILWVSREII